MSSVIPRFIGNRIWHICSPDLQTRLPQPGTTTKVAVASRTLSLVPPGVEGSKVTVQRRSPWFRTKGAHFTHEVALVATDIP